ncbi:NACHT domain-containing protein [Actinocorallia herbida]|uniref:NACHT domain-containing protein n=1 Tax=Actinocorallia herbida TaxID=58109 RepID=UPI0014774C8A|nr:NACHT domain-containing protein [Actinocorallia herbida]
MAGLLGVGVFLRKAGLEKADQYASVLALLVALGAAGVHTLRWARRDRSEDDPDKAVRLLVRAVRTQWAREAEARRLLRPRPLRLRWRTAPPDVRAGASGGGHGSLPPTDTRLPAAADLAAALHAADGPLVVLGEPGAGKTTTALLLLLALLEDAPPVPVLLSARDWDPAQGVETWLARRIGEDYPALQAVCAPAAHIADRGVLLILDGLDEMPRSLLPAAIDDLDRAAGSGLPLVLTCRTADYTEAVASSGPLSRASVLEIEPVGASDSAVYLAERDSPTAAARWRPVLDALLREDGGPLAQALSTPLMISLARRVYQDPDSRPAHLVDLPDADAVRDHLLSALLPAAYDTPADAARAERRLSFLAQRSRPTERSTLLPWWRLASLVPAPVIALMTAVPILLTSVAVAVFFFRTTDYREVTGSPSDYSFVALLGGLALAAVSASNCVRIARPAADSRSGSRVGRVVGAVFVALAGVGLGWAALLVLHPGLAASSKRLIAALAVLDGMEPSIDGEGWFGYGPFVGVVVLVSVVLSTGVSTRHAALPRRTALRVRALWRHLATGFAVGLVVAAAWTLPSFNGDLAEDARTALTALAVAGPLFGIGRWISAPADETNAAGPEESLRGDRTSHLVFLGGTVSTVLIILFAVMTAVDAEPTTITAALAVVAVSLTVVLAFNSGSVWPVFVMARLWLALRGHLPWRYSAFLRDAHARGVLRQAGPVHEFRHALLAAHLATRAGTGGALTQRRARRHPARNLAVLFGAAIASWTLLLGTARAIVAVEVPEPAFTLPIRSGPPPPFDRTGARLALLNPDGDLEIHETRHGALLTRAPADPMEWPAGFSPDGRWLLTLVCARDSCHTQVRRTSDLAVAAVLNAPEDLSVGPPTFAEDGSSLAALLCDGVCTDAVLWNLEDGTSRALSRPSPSASLLAVTAADAKGADLVAARDGTLIHVRLTADRTVWTRAFTDDTDLVLTESLGHLWACPRNGPAPGICTLTDTRGRPSPAKAPLARLTDLCPTAARAVTLWSTDANRADLPSAMPPSPVARAEGRYEYFFEAGGADSYGYMGTTTAFYPDDPNSHLTLRGDDLDVEAPEADPTRALYSAGIGDELHVWRLPPVAPPRRPDPLC